MSQIKLKKLVITGVDGRHSFVEFGDKLTIICGPSNTGKSYIFKCVEYLFGKDEVPFDAKRTGYNRVSLTMETKLGNITLIRDFGSKKVRIEATNSSNKLAGIYDTAHDGTNPLNRVFSQILGVPEDLMLPSKQDGTVERFSWKNLRQAFLVHELQTESDVSVFVPKYNGTLFLSDLIYILYEKDLSEFNAEETEKIRKIKASAVKDYIDNKKVYLSEMKTKADNYAKDKNIIDIDTQINFLQEKLNEINNKINSSLEKRNNVNKAITNVTDNISELTSTIASYNALITQYEGDIKRLGFIVDGEKINHIHNDNEVCPFCSGRIQKEKAESHLEAAKSEVVRIVDNINELKAIIADNEEDLKIEKAHLLDFENQKNELDNLINFELKNTQDKLSNEISHLREVIQIKEQLEIIKDFESQYEFDISELNNKPVKPIVYKPKDEFPDSFYTEMGNNYYSILEEMHYKPLYSASFDKATFDSIINGEKRSENGKGYRAFLNSINILSLRKYINEFAQINPHLYFIDSPMHGLQINDKHNTEEGIRRGFFEYLINNVGNDQIIIIENLNDHDLPPVLENNVNVKVIRFTHSDEGRYGLLLNYKEGVSVNDQL